MATLHTFLDAARRESLATDPDHGPGPGRVLDFTKAQAAQKFAADLAAAKRPARVSKTTKSALQAQAVRFAAALSL